VFEVNEAKKEILEHLVIRDWTPTDLAEELDKSTNTVYNHLGELHERGLLTRTQVPAKTRPKTQYSIGEGFLQYIAVLPGRYTEKSVELTPEKQAILHIWDIPQEEFHPFVQKYWWALTNSADGDDRDDV
jgi:predicted ArsR family transcriptional regulator